MKYTFHELLHEIANGKREVTIQLPDLKPIKGIITDINLTNPTWKPIKVHLITKGLQITDFRFVENEWVGEVKEEYQRPYTEDWFNIDYIIDINFENNKQIEINL